MKNNEAFRAAAENGNARAVELLLADKRVDPTAQNNFAIVMASWNGHSGAVFLPA